MKITEVKVFPTKSKDGKLKAFATMTFDDCFVVRNLKIIKGSEGFFVAMPSRKAVVSCDKCSSKNPLDSRYCAQCGGKITADPGKENDKKIHMDVAHPVTRDCRDYIQKKILEEYNSRREDLTEAAGDENISFSSEEQLEEDALTAEEGKDIEL